MTDIHTVLDTENDNAADAAQYKVRQCFCVRAEESRYNKPDEGDSDFGEQEESIAVD